MSLTVDAVMLPSWRCVGVFGLTFLRKGRSCGGRGLFDTAMTPL